MEAANFEHLEKSLAEHQFLGGYFHSLYNDPLCIDKPPTTSTEKLMNN